MTRSRRVRVIVGVAAIILGFLCAPAALALQAAEGYSMSCCVGRGACCCSPDDSRGTDAGGQQAPLLRHSRMSGTCPGGCTSSQTSSNFQYTPGIPLASHADGSIPTFFLWAGGSPKHSDGNLSSAGPRAPPFKITAR